MKGGFKTALPCPRHPQQKPVVAALLDKLPENAKNGTSVSTRRKEKAMTKRKKGFNLPHVYTLAFVLIILFAILTWVIPSGSFDRQIEETAAGEREVVIPGSYHEVPKVSEENGDLRQGVMEILMAPTRGIQGAADVIAFVLLVGGSFKLINKTDAIMAGMKKVIRKLKGKSSLIIPICVLLFGLGGTSFGMSEECLPFYMILMPVLMAMGYDSMTVFLVVFFGACMGYSASTTNPFSVLIAQGIAGVEGNPQIVFRYIQWAIYMIVAIAFIMIRGKRILANPQLSVTYEDDIAKREEFIHNDAEAEDDVFTTRQKLVLVVFGIGMALLVYGLLHYGWYMDEISMIFLGMGLLSGIIGGMSEKEIAESFVEGMSEFVYAAVAIGFARGILVVAEGGMIMDTILNFLANLLAGVPRLVFTTCASIVYSLLSIMMPSSSGVAALTMPIFAPLADLLSINKEALVTAFQYGNNNMNLICPINPMLVAGLGVCKITLSQYWKTVWKVTVLVFVLGWVFAGISAFI